MKNKRMFLFLLFACSLFGKEQTDILFYLQDAGETYALLPVIEKLEERGIDYRVLTAGVAQGIVGCSSVPKCRVLNFKDLKIESEMDRKEWTRNRALTDHQIACLMDEIEPREVVGGVAYESQGQVLGAYTKRGIPTFAYWDNFNACGDNLYFSVAHSVESRAETLLLPNFLIECSFSHRKDKKVVGHPTLEKWKKEIDCMNLDCIREKLGICPHQKIVVFVGGYGCDYEEAFRLFLEGVLCDSYISCIPDEIFFLVLPHPKGEGVFERIQLKRFSPCPIRVLEGELSTMEAVALADLVLCHQSTVAFQALAANKPVVHLIPEGQNYRSAPLEKGLAKRVSDSESLVGAIHQEIDEHQSHGSADGFFEAMQVPENSVDLLLKALLEKL